MSSDDSPVTPKIKVIPPSVENDKEETKRKVSIMTEPSSNVGHENFGYDRKSDESPSRKISSQNIDDPIRKKSILHNPLTPVQQAQQLSQIQANEPVITQQPVGVLIPTSHHMNNRHMDGKALERFNFRHTHNKFN